jgi:hypothetical protein
MQGKLLLKGVPDNANVFVDGKKVALENNALFVEPFANHSLVVSATGRKNFSSDKLQLEMAGNIDVNVRCIKKPSWYPWLLFGGGLAFMGTGGYFLGVGLTGTPSYSFDGSGSVTNIGYHQAIGQQEEARRSGIIGIVGLSVGGAMLIGSVLWMLLEDTTPPEWRKK